MRGSLILAAALALAACSSPIASSGVPRTSNAEHQLPTANPSSQHLTLQFKNESPHTHLQINGLAFTCVKSITPPKISLANGETVTVDITADTNGNCHNYNREVDFDMDFTDEYGSHSWRGDLDVWYTPQVPGWAAELRGYGAEICTDPPGFVNRLDLHDNELISFHFCKQH